MRVDIELVCYIICPQRSGKRGKGLRVIVAWNIGMNIYKFKKLIGIQKIAPCQLIIISSGYFYRLNYLNITAWEKISYDIIGHGKLRSGKGLGDPDIF